LEAGTKYFFAFLLSTRLENGILAKTFCFCQGFFSWLENEKKKISGRIRKDSNITSVQQATRLIQACRKNPHLYFARGNLYFAKNKYYAVCSPNLD